MRVGSIGIRVGEHGGGEHGDEDEGDEDGGELILNGYRPLQVSDMPVLAWPGSPSFGLALAVMV